MLEHYEPILISTILWLLRFGDANSQRRNRSEDKFQPIGDVFERWDLSLSDVYTPSPHVTVDEHYLSISKEDAHFGSIFGQNLANME